MNSLTRESECLYHHYIFKICVTPLQKKSQVTLIGIEMSDYKTRLEALLYTLRANRVYHAFSTPEQRRNGDAIMFHAKPDFYYLTWV